jgi:virginiamycin A acetyltransferase
MRFTNKRWKYRKYEIGDYTYGTPQIFQWDEVPRAKLKIGKFCMIAPEVKIFLGGNHHTDCCAMYPIQALVDNNWDKIEGHCISKGDVTIGNDVWIGYNVTILSGVKIGNGAVIGANSNVTKDVPDFAIVGGNPARVLKYRTCQLHWWEWTMDNILRNWRMLKNMGDK